MKCVALRLSIDSHVRSLMCRSLDVLEDDEGNPIGGALSATKVALRSAAEELGVDWFLNLVTHRGSP